MVYPIISRVSTIGDAGFLNNPQHQSGGGGNASASRPLWEHQMLGMSYWLLPAGSLEIDGGAPGGHSR